MRSETNEEVRQNLAPDEIPIFNRVAASIKGGERVSRTEAFREYLEAHPGEAVEAVDRLAEWKLKQELRPMLDFYETPAWAIRALCPVIDTTPRRAVVLDPGCGTGAILRTLSAARPDWCVSGIEKEKGRHAEAQRLSPNVPITHGDFLYHQDRADLIVSNPPYAIALTFVQHALTLAPVVAMLLRLPWLASQSRAEWHKENPAHVCVLPRRPSFTGDGKTDATDYAWFVWGTRHAGRWTILDVEPRRKQEGSECPF